MRRFIITLLVFLSVIALVVRFSSKPLEQFLGLKQRAGMRVESNTKAKVLLDKKDMGEVPFQNEELSEGEYLLEVVPQNQATDSAKASWQGYVRLNGGTLTVVNRELAQTSAESSGEVITLEKGKGATVVSTPSSAEVFIDGQSRGRTPVSIEDLSSGEHQFLLSKDNFLKRSIRATLVEGYSLNLSVDLAISEADLSKISTPPTPTSQEVIVKQTPTGFLRIRSGPSTNSQEVARVSPGDRLILLEELSSWSRVKTSSGVDGYVSSVYIEKAE